MSTPSLLVTNPASKERDQKEWPVVEAFGPTVQGEGPLAGVPCYFVRLAACDYRCSWCDSMHAVDPKVWKGVAKYRSAEQIVRGLDSLDDGPVWVTISGGNPGLWNLTRLVRLLQHEGFKVAVETQGSRWQTWMQSVDMLVTSPKPPSSGMASEKHLAAWHRFLDRCVRSHPNTTGATSACKIVVATDEDYEWAVERFDEVRNRRWWLGLSVMTPQYAQAPTDPEARDVVGHLYAKLCDKAKLDPRMADVHVLPQLHVIAYGYRVGV